VAPIVESAAVTVPKGQLDSSNYKVTRLNAAWRRPATAVTYQLRFEGSGAVVKIPVNIPAPNTKGGPVPAPTDFAAADQSLTLSGSLTANITTARPSSCGFGSGPNGALFDFAAYFQVGDTWYLIDFFTNTSAKQYSDLDDVIGAKRGEYSLVVVLDGVEDPHNLGAILRTADAAGADGVVIPERRSAAVTGTVTKTSAGASEYLPIAKVTNIARTVEELKGRNLWTVGLDEHGPQTYDALDYNMDCALVLGAEGKGLHDLVKRKCDFLVSIPMLGNVPSLNVSVAAAVVLYEIVRQRRNGKTSPDKQ